MPEDSFLPPHGNYQELLSFQKAEIVYDLTYRFAHNTNSKVISVEVSCLVLSG